MIKKTLLAIVVCIAALSSQSQLVYINEVMASNKNGIEDDWFDTEDWLEFYYAPDQDPTILDLAGYFVTDDPADLTKFQIPDTDPALTKILSGQHLMFWVDKDPEQGADHLDFKLSSEGETIMLVAPDGTTIIDSIELGVQAPDISYGRECDGCEEWVFFNNTTPDDNNGEILQDAQDLYINEVLADNVNNIDDLSDEHEPWLEIYNPNLFQVNLSDYYISNTDDALLYQIAHTNPVLTVVPAGEWLILWCDGEEEEGENHIPISLATTGGTLRLTAPDAVTEVDSYDYEETSADISYGRSPDAALSSITFSTPTPRVTNTLIIVIPEELYINELLADNELDEFGNAVDTLDNYGENEDWFEIYNPNTFPVNIAGYYFTDNIENPAKWQVPFGNPDSTTVPAEGWLLFWADEDGNQGVNHTSFRLNNMGEQLMMYSSDAFTLVDEKSWNNEQNNISKGRETDGGSSWVHFTETTPEASNNGADVSVFETNLETPQLLAYPNPNNTGLVRLNEQISGGLFDSFGRLIMQYNNVSVIQVDKLISGSYFLRSEDGRVVRIIKL